MRLIVSAFTLTLLLSPAISAQDSGGSMDVQLFFADHKQVNNLWLPHRIVKGVNGQMMEEWKIGKYKLNPDIKPNKFEKKK